MNAPIDHRAEAVRLVEDAHAYGYDDPIRLANLAEAQVHATLAASTPAADRIESVDAQLHRELEELRTAVREFINQYDGDCPFPFDLVNRLRDLTRGAP